MLLQGADTIDLPSFPLPPGSSSTNNNNNNNNTNNNNNNNNNNNDDDDDDDVNALAFAMPSVPSKQHTNVVPQSIEMTVGDRVDDSALLLAMPSVPSKPSVWLELTFCFIVLFLKNKKNTWSFYSMCLHQYQLKNNLKFVSIFSLFFFF